MPTDVPAVQRNPALKLAIGDSLFYTGTALNTDNGPRADSPIGRDALVRQAFELSLDRAAIIRVVYDGLYTPTAQANSPSSPYYVPSIQPPPRDIGKARALLQQAGLKPPVPVALLVGNSADTQQVAEVMQAMAREAGFDVKITAMEAASSLQTALAGRFEAFNAFWSGRIDPDGNMYQFLHSGGAFNYGHYSNREMDRLLDGQRRTGDAEERQALIAKIWEQERKDLPLIYLWNPKNTVGMRKQVQGFVQIPDGIIRLQGMSIAP